MLTDILLLIGGLVLLIGGGELLVRGAVKIAARLGLSPMLIGLTVVGMGTSMPELAASVQAAAAGSPGIALGNIVGSNLANTLLILGIAALIAPIAVPRGVLWRDGGVGLGAAVLLLLAGWFTGLNRPAGALFVLLLIGYIYYAYRKERVGGAHSAAYDRGEAVVEVDPALSPSVTAQGSLLVSILLFVGGLGLVVGGGSLLVRGAVSIAQGAGITEEVIGLTIVAIGTSLPELVTSAIAALRKQGEIALGNVLGSNIYNVLFIGGVTGLVTPGAVPPSIVAFDLPLMIGASAALMFFAWTGGRLARREGAAFFAAYVLYTVTTAGLIAV